jgi:hypothetical protein
MPTCGTHLAVREREGEVGELGRFGSLLCWSFPGQPSGWPFSFFCSVTFSIFYFQFCLIYLFDTNLFGFGLNFNFCKTLAIMPRCLPNQ